MPKLRIPNIDLLVSRIVLIYFSLGTLWIAFSDSLLALFVPEQALYAHFSLYKGFAFILFTSVMLYLLVRNTLHQQARLEQSLSVSEERWKFALEGAGEGVWDWNLQTDEVFRSGQWHKIYGYAENDIGKTAADGRQLIHPEDLPRAVEDINAYLQGNTDSFTSEFRLLCKDGSWKWTLSRGMIVKTSADGRPLRMIGTHTNISERKYSEDQIFRLAHFDSVTGLPNRVLFQDRLQQDIEIAKRSSYSLALMFLDLDRFKEVNDTLGHDAGDALLKEAARRLLECVRVSDTVARLGGDEFTIILNNSSSLTSVEHVAQQVLSRLSRPFELGDEIVYVSASVGITMFPQDAEEAEVLLKNADQAMYAAKEQGRNCMHFFTPSMQQASVLRMRLANDLRSALNARQFEVHYQPIVELSTGAIRKAEALIRWQHPTRGLVAPAEFIPVAEDKGMIVEIGDLVFIEVAERLARWRERFSDFQVSINKSPVQLKNDRSAHLDWIGHLRSLGLAGDALVVEITESVLLDAQNSVTKRLQEFHEAGLEIAIDDFGTGYSSLAYIKKFDINYVKIDQSFTRGLTPGSDDHALCEAIIVMAHKLGMQVIAEGVETRLQHDLLASAGCDYGQGYLYSRPLPLHQFEALIYQSQRD